MRFSILLPTRDRLDYLRLAVQSVLRQEVQDWEIVISDNCSADDIAGYVDSLSDPRILYSRTDRPLPVTENWNRALARSSGQYVVMLGDDDALLGDYLRRMNELTERFESPDVIYTKALLFTYPGVDPAHPDGFLMDHGCADFFSGASEPFILDHSRAVELVRAAMSFRLRYDFNAQFALMSRRLIDALGEYGDFYQSDFPDYYSMNAAFLRANRIVVEPAPQVVIGVTPKSYGYFHVNEMETEGRSFLDGQGVGTAPGSNINVGWLSAMSALEQGPAAGLGLRVDHRRYRLVQAAHVYARHRAGVDDAQEMRALEAELPLLERLGYRVASAALRLAHGALPATLKESFVRIALRVVGQHPAVAPEFVVGRYRDALDVVEDRTPAPSAGATHDAGGH